MGKNKNNTISLRRYFKRIYIALCISFLVFLGLAIALGVGYAVTENGVLLVSLLASLGVCLAIFTIVAVYIIRFTYNIFYKNLYENTCNNYELLKDDKRLLNHYTSDGIEEFDILNGRIDDLLIHNSTLEILPRKYDYSKIPLEYLNKKENLVNQSSFIRNIREIIYCSRFLRNGVLSISYDENALLDDKSIHEIVRHINRLFDMDGTLISIKDNANGFYVYIPAIESLATFKFSLEDLLQKLTISKKTLNGIELLSPRLNAVIYPFSNIADIFSDLAYSERQEERVNIYLPHRYINSANDTLFEQSTNINNIYKIVASISRINLQNQRLDAFIEKLEEPLRQTALFYTFDQAGLILYDKEKGKFINSLPVKFDDKAEFVFPQGEELSKNFIDGVIESVDPDGSLFFSKRKYLLTKIGREFDILNISSGFIYRSLDVTGNCSAIVYFINLDKKELPLNSYLQSALMVFCAMLSNTLSNNLVLEDINDVKERELNILKLTNIRSYIIDRNTYEIKNFSPSLKKDIPDIEIGQLCYKAMFGFDKPCTQCPLLSKQKSIKLIRGTQYEVSSVLNNKYNTQTELTLSGINVNPQTTNQFDKDYLINTNYSFIERLNDLYNAKARGYVALLKIRNIDTLVDKLGSEGFSFLIRKFTKEINDTILKSNEIYKYKNDTLAIIFSSAGKLDATQAIEKIYTLSKKHYIQDEESIELEISYDVTKYPQEHSNSEDFIRHIETLCAESNDTLDRDYLYIEENDFRRPASKEAYILSIINEATAAKNFIIKCQPMVNGTTRAIFGSELLIRLSDKYYNSLLDTEEVVAVAAKYGKLYNVSDILIDYVGNLFKTNGVSIFKPAGFTRMSINADYNYFKDSFSITKIIDAMNKYHLPKEFLTFEVTEAEIARHYDSFKEVVTTLRRNDIDIVCDRYFGDNLSFAKLKDLGITEVKSDRSVVMNIDINNDKFTSLTKLLQSGDELKMNMTLVGVENGEQYNLIKGLNIKCNLQGYYFHHPLSSNELIEAIRNDNVM